MANNTNNNTQKKPQAPKPANVQTELKLEPKVEKVEKIEVKFICDVFGDHGIFKKNQVATLSKKETDYFLKIKVAVKC